MNKKILNTFVLASAFALVSTVQAANNDNATEAAYQDCQSCCQNFYKKHHRSGPLGFDKANVIDIKTLKKEAKDDQMVKLQGSLTAFLGDDKYTFTDLNKDSIVIELDDDRDWSYLEKDMPIEIVAKVDKDLINTELELVRARPLKEKAQRAPANF